MVHLFHDFCSHQGVPKNISLQIELALHELATNVISYAWNDQNVHELSIRLARSSGRIDIEVRDDGRPFDPLSRAAPDTNAPLEERSVGGLGIFFVKSLTDAAEYRREGAYNRLRLMKIIP